MLLLCEMDMQLDVVGALRTGHPDIKASSGSLKDFELLDFRLDVRNVERVEEPPRVGATPLGTSTGQQDRKNSNSSRKTQIRLGPEEEGCSRTRRT
ncbi:hypothetical protein EYF80_024268 [Liparis tanakae]|uniref:Uncharacterized protein n=1 Tax=Liparis tanakae TaxID=230148 RepID=A0A4Z2HHR8_9TELE|nr:hypothetical protein EYF80_024268 [Liparis tanakae]